MLKPDSPCRVNWRGEAHLSVSHEHVAPLGKVITMSMQPHSPQERDAKLTELHERLVASVDALVTGDEWKRALEFAAHFRNRSFNNTLLIWAQHSAAHESGLVASAVPSYVAGFRQWNTLGRHVVAGQKGYMIFAPVTARFATSSPVDVGSWRRLDRNERPRPGEIVRQQMVGSRPAYVWDVSQTAGQPIQKLPAPILLTGEAPSGLWDGLSALVRGAGFTILSKADAASLGGANGVTNFTSRTVSVRADMDAAAQVKTLAHELAHIRMHQPEAGAISHRGIGEVEAESVALMIGAAHGMDTSDYTIPYVSGWASSVSGKTATEVAQETGERVRRVAVAILDQLPTDQIGADDPLVFEREKLSTTLVVAPSTDLAAVRPEVRSL